MTASSRAIAMVYESRGSASRSRQCRDSWPGISVVQDEPLTNEPCNVNSAGGSSQFLTSVIYIHANARVAVASTECSVSHAMSIISIPHSPRAGCPMSPGVGDVGGMFSTSNCTCLTPSPLCGLFPRIAYAGAEDVPAEVLPALRGTTPTPYPIPQK